jgi:ABC-2 type transport system ATP-binding protein
MGDVVATRGLSKRFGDLAAVVDLHLQVRAGEIYGFLGLNGAGKTTTIRMILGMIGPTAGEVELFGRPLARWDDSVWRRVGHLVESPAAYPELTVRENLEVARRLAMTADDTATDRVIDLFELGSQAGKRARVLSSGNLQRLGLAKAMIGSPELLLLDEPANGLDPAGVVEIRDLLGDLVTQHGVTVFMSSHILSEVDRLATRIGIIHDGRLVEELDSDELERRRRAWLSVDAADREAARRALTEAGFAPVAHEDGLRLGDARAVDHPEEIAGLLVKAGAPPTKLVVAHEDLEAHFLRLTGTGAQEAAAGGRS